MTARNSTAAGPELLAECEVAVCGGGIAGTVAALELAAAGRDVLLIEQRIALMWELTRARQQADAGVIGAASPLLAGLIRELRTKGALDGDTFHPVVLQLVLDALARDAGLKVLYQVSPIDLEREHDTAWLSVASKGRKRSIRAATVLDASDYGVLSRSSARGAAGGELLWHLVLANATLAHTQVATLPLGRHAVTARVRAAAGDGLALVDLVVPAWDAAAQAPEVRLAQLLEPAIEALRARVDGLERAAIVYVAEEPYPLLARAESPAAGAERRQPAASEHGPRGIGLWSSASDDGDAGLPAWECSRRRNTRQALGGCAFARALLLEEHRATGSQ